jgi:DNA-binding transcriptional ArsR family regulator
MEDKVTLDRKAFKTLASGTRVGILKSLGVRRKTLTEISKEFGMSPSTIKEHMDSLVLAGLAIQIDDGHKWKYYELTRKARDILHPAGTRVYIVLALSLLAIIVTSWDLIRETLLSPAQALRNEALGAAGDSLVQAIPAASGGAVAIPYAHIAALAVFACMFGIALGYMIARRMAVRGF